MSPAAPDPAPVRILIAEDHLIARMGVKTILSMQPDMSVAGEASNGTQAVELYRKLQPDVVLMDMRMPVLNGVDAARAIRTEFPDARIIGLSTYGGDEDIRRALHAGMRSYLTKDVLHDELIRAIHAVHAGETYLTAEVRAILGSGSLPAGLSARETEVLGLIVKGKSNKQIGFDLGIAEHTVKNHVKSILDKLGVDDRTQAATEAIQRGIIHL
ncbi:MAG TPA: response regulator transcription factor [Bryobacteraceae bacterium]|nr:response regulator transcription factor [Bryobacteraceae bacterium]